MSERRWIEPIDRTDFAEKLSPDSAVTKTTFEDRPLALLVERLPGEKCARVPFGWSEMEVKTKDGEHCWLVFIE